VVDTEVQCSFFSRWVRIASSQDEPRTDEIAYTRNGLGRERHRLVKAAAIFPWTIDKVTEKDVVGNALLVDEQPVFQQVCIHLAVIKLHRHVSRVQVRHNADHTWRDSSSENDKRSACSVVGAVASVRINTTSELGSGNREHPVCKALL